MWQNNFVTLFREITWRWCKTTKKYRRRKIRGRINELDLEISFDFAWFLLANLLFENGHFRIFFKRSKDSMCKLFLKIYVYKSSFTFLSITIFYELHFHKFIFIFFLTNEKKLKIKLYKSLDKFATAFNRSVFASLHNKFTRDISVNKIANDHSLAYLDLKLDFFFCGSLKCWKYHFAGVSPKNRTKNPAIENWNAQKAA